MRVSVAVTAFIGLACFCALMAWARQRTVFAEHYEFRRTVRPGMAQADLVSAFGRPYRTLWTPRAALAALSGRGAFRSFDRDVSSPDRLPAGFAKVVHYRTTPIHGEFVFLDEDGTVLLVVTGRVAADR